MDNKSTIDLSAALKNLLAENKSQHTRLDEYAKIIDSRDAEIEMLQSMLSEANAYRSSTDGQLRQLNDLEQYIGNLQQQVAGVVTMNVHGRHRSPASVSAELQLKELTADYAELQARLGDLQQQLTGVSNQNLLLQQQNSRIAELESLLDNAEEEIARWKARSRV